MASDIDFTSPWLLDTHTLGRRPGEMVHVDRQVTLEEPLGLDFMTIPKGAQVGLSFRLEAVSEGVLVSGEVRGEAEGECVRCLAPVQDMLSVEICELYAYPESSTSATTTSDEVSVLVAEHADVEQAVRDALVLVMPATPYCREDCKGLCPECGERFADLEADHAHPQADLRWEGLRPLLEEAHRTVSQRQE